MTGLNFSQMEELQDEKMTGVLRDISSLPGETDDDNEGGEGTDFIKLFFSSGGVEGNESKYMAARSVLQILLLLALRERVGCNGGVIIESTTKCTV